jgi:TatD DNase family protein
LDFIDTHCHLNLFQNQNDLESVVKRSMDLGVTKIVIPGINVSTSRRAVELAETFPSVFAAVGIHPHEVSNYADEDITVIEELALSPKVVAVGEIGLDYHYPPINKDSQKHLLQIMLEISDGVSKPVILHSRDSMSDLLAVIRDWEINKKQTHNDQHSSYGVFHSFEGSVSDAQQIRKMKYIIGIGGSITFKNNIQLQQLVKDVGIEDIVLETDSPFLSPHPFRGVQNEPSRIPLIAQKVADLLEIQVELVADRTTRNANNLFSWNDQIV